MNAATILHGSEYMTMDEAGRVGRAYLEANP